MLQLKNKTPFPGMLALLPDRDGVDTVYTVVKGTFTLGAAPGLADEQEPVAPADKYHGDPGATSIRVPSDLCLGKAGTDVVMIGSAWSPGGRPAWHADVSLTVGSLNKTIRVFGDRVWESGPAGATVAWVAPFERVPLVWERAYGGTDQTDEGQTADARNPVGVGFRARDGTKPLPGMPLPNVEDPAALISSWRDAPVPAGFAPVAPHWEPRRAYAGTYDAAWQKNRAPYLPTDFDSRFFQVAPPGLAAVGYLQGGEPVELRGVTAAGLLQFYLPAPRLQVVYRLDVGDHETPVWLDTVILEPDGGRVLMVWRAALRCDKKARKVREVEATLVGSS